MGSGGGRTDPSTGMGWNDKVMYTRLHPCTLII